MKQMNFKQIIKSVPACLLAFTIALPAVAQQTLSDYSVLPENLTGDVTTNPNILIIIDNSTSMERFRTPDVSGGDYVTDPETGVQYMEGINSFPDPSSSFSNSYKVREAILGVLDSDAFKGRLNVGVMAFGQNRCTYDESDNDVNPDDRENSIATECFGPTNGGTGNRGTSGLGVLRANIAPLDGAHKTRLLNLLALEPTPWTDDGTLKNISSTGGDDYLILPPAEDRPVNGRIHPFHSPVAAEREINGTEETILTLPGGNHFNFTPLGGSLETAFRYLFKNELESGTVPSGLDAEFTGGLLAREIGLPFQSDPNDPTSAPVQEAVGYLTASQCEGDLTVILLTDGEPTQLPPSDLSTGTGSTGSGSTYRNSAVNAARRIHFRGYETVSTGEANVAEADRVKVHVIGFRLLNASTANSIAAAGGTGAAKVANSSEDVAQAFTDIFSDILTQGATRSGISIIATPNAAAGSFIQPSFTPLTKSGLANDDEEVNWSGQLRNFYTDRFGNFREDNGTVSAQLDADDRGFEILSDNDTGRAYVRRFTVAADGEKSNFEGVADPEDPAHIAVSELVPIWSARERLDAHGDLISSIGVNRDYATPPSATGPARYIFTGIDTPNAEDNSVRGAEVFPFEWSASDANKFSSSKKGYLDLPGTANTDDDARDLINFIRGAEFDPKFRNRTLNNEKYLLGDIVHSTPVQVDGPTPLTFPTNPLKTQALRDSYEPFAKRYAERRKMIYVGANDGMLHAFNGGFWDVDSSAGTIEVTRQRDSSPTGINFELGDEVWAYVPQAVLPHLKFLSNPNYLADEHIAFVDGSLQAFDVKIFDSDTAAGCDNIAATGTAPSNCRYVNGWGTILVGGLRLGGANYTADFDGDGLPETMRSSFFIMDITDPEKPPVLIDEITDPELNLTTSKPALVRTSISGGTPDYKLVFGSGPTDLQTVTNPTLSRAKLFVYDFDSPGTLTSTEVAAAAEGSFSGDITAVDWDLDDVDDAVYFGTIAGTQAIPTGKLMRAKIKNDGKAEPGIFLDVNQAVQHEPVSPAINETLDDKFIVFGTGRTFAIEDLGHAYSSNHQLFGVKEAFNDDGSINFAQSPVTTVGDLLDTSGQTESASNDQDVVLIGKTRRELLEKFEAEDIPGWRFTLPKNTSRLTARPATIDELAFFTDFQPQDPATITPDQCIPTGQGKLSILDIRTGIAVSLDRLSVDGDQSGNTGEQIEDFLNLAVSNSLLGAGQVLVIGINEDGSKEITFKAPGANQEVTEFEATLIPPPNPALNTGRKSWREITL